MPHPTEIPWEADLTWIHRWSARSKTDTQNKDRRSRRRPKGPPPGNAPGRDRRGHNAQRKKDCDSLLRFETHVLIGCGSTAKGFDRQNPLSHSESADPASGRSRDSNVAWTLLGRDKRSGKDLRALFRKDP